MLQQFSSRYFGSCSNRTSFYFLLSHLRLPMLKIAWSPHTLLKYLLSPRPLWLTRTNVNLVPPGCQGYALIQNIPLLLNTHVPFSWLHVESLQVLNPTYRFSIPSSLEPVCLPPNLANTPPWEARITTLYTFSTSNLRQAYLRVYAPTPKHSFPLGRYFFFFPPYIRVFSVLGVFNEALCCPVFLSFFFPLSKFVLTQAW